MKITITLFLLALLTISCGKKEEMKLQAFSPEAFAYDIGDGWEVNATVNVKGFGRSEMNDEVHISLSYSVDLISPDSVVTKDLFSDVKEVSDKEITDVQLEAQFDLPSSSPLGKYNVVFSIIDNKTKQTTTAQADFELEE